MSITQWEVGKLLRYIGELDYASALGGWVWVMYDGVPRRVSAVSAGGGGVAFEGVVDGTGKEDFSYGYNLQDFVEVDEAATVSTETFPNFRSALRRRRSFFAKVTPEQSSILQAVAFQEGVFWASADGSLAVIHTDKPILYFEVCGDRCRIGFWDDHADITDKYPDSDSEYIFNSDSFAANPLDPDHNDLDPDIDPAMQRMEEQRRELEREVLSRHHNLLNQQMIAPAPRSEFVIVNLLNDLAPVVHNYKELGVSPEWLLNYVATNSPDMHQKQN